MVQMCVIERCHGASLALEPPAPLVVGGERRRQNLDRNAGAKPRIAGPAGAKRIDDFVRAQARPGSERHTPLF
jgi:hypothetical protein